MSCWTCKLLKDGLIVSIKEIQKKEDSIIKELCSLIPDHFNIPLAQCESIVEQVVPYGVTALIELLSEKEDFLCGMIFSACASPGIAWYDTEGLINRIVSETPPVITKPAAMGANGTYTIL